MIDTNSRNEEMVPETGLPFLDLASPQFSTRSDEVRRARRAAWCVRTPYGLAVLRHREAGELLRDRRVRQGSYAWPESNGLSGSFAEFWGRSVIAQEGKKHRSLRMITSAALSAEFVESLRPAFSKIARDIVSGLSNNDRCEFMQDFANPFASRAMCLLLGLPASTWPSIASDAASLGLAMGVNCKAHAPAINAAYDRLERLAHDLVSEARTDDDSHSLVSRYVSRRDNHGTIDDSDLIDLVVITVFGGVDTTRSQLGNSMALFAEHPEQWRILRQNPDLAANAVEESIRAFPTTTWVTREALVDFTYRGHDIQKGQTLHILVHSTSRDPKICGNPSFDITAPRKSHFGFGGGAHHCLGHLVARTDIACAMVELSRTFNSISLAHDPCWLPDSGNTGPISLPLVLSHEAP